MKKIFALLLALALCVAPLLLAVPSFAAAGPDDPVVPGNSGYGVRFIFDDGRDPLVCNVLVDTSISVSVSSSGFSLVYTDYNTSSEVNETVTVADLYHLFDDLTQTAYYPGDSFSVSSSQDIRVVSFDDSLPDTGESFDAYGSAYDLLHRYLYGGNELNSYQEFTLVQLATYFVLFAAFIPFILVFFGIKLFCGGR